MCNVSLTWTIICSFICCYLTGGLRDWKVFHLFNLVYTFAAVFVSTVLGLSHKTLQCSYPCCFSLLWPRHRQIKRHVYIFWILILKMCSLSVGWQNLFVNPLKFFSQIVLERCSDVSSSASLTTIRTTLFPAPHMWDRRCTDSGSSLHSVWSCDERQPQTPRPSKLSATPNPQTRVSCVYVCYKERERERDLVVYL